MEEWGHETWNLSTYSLLSKVPRAGDFSSFSEKIDDFLL